MAAHTNNPERRIWHFISEADAATAAGEDDGTKLPFIRRGQTIFSWTGWLDDWFSGKVVKVSRGDPKRPGGRGRPRKIRAIEHGPERISPRTGLPVRSYRRRTPESHAARAGP